jgi:hypothetical protein
LGVLVERVIGFLQLEISMTAWQKTYPTVETVMLANFETVCTWCDELPPPQTDVERTVRRRLEAQRKALGALELRKQAPAVADRINELIDSMERLGIKSHVSRVP